MGTYRQCYGSLQRVLWEPTDSVMGTYRQCYGSLPTVLWELTDSVMGAYRQCYGSLPENLISIKTSANNMLTATCGTCISKRLLRLYTLKSKFWSRLNNVSLDCYCTHFAFKLWHRYFTTAQRNRTSEIPLKNVTKFCNEFSNIFFFYVHGSVHSKNIPICVQQDATLHSLFYLETALHVSGGITTHHQECKQLYAQHLV